MSDRERFRRDDPERIAPRRQMSGTYRADPWATSAPLHPGDRGEEDPADEAVDAARRVMDEHVREERRGSKRGRGHWYDEEPGVRRSGDDLQSLVERLVSIYADVIPILIDFLHSFGGSISRGRPYDGNEGWPYDRDREGGGVSGHHSRRHQEGAASFPIEVHSARPVRILADIADIDNSDLVVAPLRAIDPSKPPLTKVSLVPGPGHRRKTLRVEIPADQPAGIYTGLVVDDRTEIARGTLTVDVGE
jgi:hypothetical protein